MTTRPKVKRRASYDTKTPRAPALGRVDRLWIGLTVRPSCRRPPPAWSLSAANACELRHLNSRGRPRGRTGPQSPLADWLRTGSQTRVDVTMCGIWLPGRARHRAPAPSRIHYLPAGGRVVTWSMLDCDMARFSALRSRNPEATHL